MRRLLLATIFAAFLGTSAHAECQADASGGGQACGSFPTAGVPADASVNQQTLSGLNLLATVAANTGRVGGYSIMNESAVTITVAFDDGAGGNVTQYVLGPAAAANQQGGYIDSAAGAFRGRIRVYGTAGSNVAIRTW